MWQMSHEICQPANAGPETYQVFTTPGKRTNSPPFTVLTLAYGTYISTCCRVERMGVLNEKALSKNDELIFPVSTLRANKMSCWVLRAANEHSLKCLSKSAYDIDVEGLRE